MNCVFIRKEDEKNVITLIVKRRKEKMKMSTSKPKERLKVPSPVHSIKVKSGGKVN